MFFTLKRCLALVLAACLCLESHATLNSMQRDTLSASSQLLPSSNRDQSNFEGTLSQLIGTKENRNFPTVEVTDDLTLLVDGEQKGTLTAFLSTLALEADRELSETVPSWLSLFLQTWESATPSTDLPEEELQRVIKKLEPHLDEQTPETQEEAVQPVPISSQRKPKFLIAMAIATIAIILVAIPLVLWPYYIQKKLDSINPNTPVDILKEYLRPDTDIRFKKRALKILEGLREKAAPVNKELIEALKDKDPEVRLQAIKILKNLKEKALNSVPALLEAMNDPNIEIRKASYEMLVSLGAGTVPQLTIYYSTHPLNPVTTKTIMKLFLELGNKAAPPLAKLLKDKDPKKRIAAIKISSFLWIQEKIILNMLEAGDPESAAAATLGLADNWLKHYNLIEIISLLDDPIFKIRQATVRLLIHRWEPYRQKVHAEIRTLLKDEKRMHPGLIIGLPQYFGATLETSLQALEKLAAISQTFVKADRIKILEEKNPTKNIREAIGNKHFHREVKSALKTIYYAMEPELALSIKLGDFPIRHRILKILRSAKVLTGDEEFLRKALVEDSSPEIRLIVAIIYQEVPTVSSARTELTKALKQDSSEIRIAVAKVFSKNEGLADKAVPELKSALATDTNATVRKYVALALGYERAPLAYKELKQAYLKDPSVEVRAAAAHSLTEAGVQILELLPHFIETLKKESNHKLRLNTLRAIKSIGSKASPAIPVLKRILTNDTNNDILIQTIETLKTFGDKTITLLPEFRLILSKKASLEVKKELMFLIMQLKDKATSAIPELLLNMEITNQGTSLFLLSYRAIKAMGASAAPVLIKLLDDPNPKISINAAQLLVHMERPANSPIRLKVASILLKAHVSDLKNYDARHYLFKNLYKKGKLSAQELLELLLDHPDVNDKWMQAFIHASIQMDDFDATVAIISKKNKELLYYIKQILSRYNLKRLMSQYATVWEPIFIQREFPHETKEKLIRLHGYFKKLKPNKPESVSSTELAELMEDPKLEEGQITTSKKWAMISQLLKRKSNRAIAFVIKKLNGFSKTPYQRQLFSEDYKKAIEFLSHAAKIKDQKLSSLNKEALLVLYFDSLETSKPNSQDQSLQTALGSLIDSNRSQFVEPLLNLLKRNMSINRLKRVIEELSKSKEAFIERVATPSGSTMFDALDPIAKIALVNKVGSVTKELSPNHPLRNRAILFLKRQTKNILFRQSAVRALFNIGSAEAVKAIKEILPSLPQSEQQSIKKRLKELGQIGMRRPSTNPYATPQSLEYSL